jgi:hypothetical protein
LLLYDFAATSMKEAAPDFPTPKAMSAGMGATFSQLPV